MGNLTEAEHRERIEQIISSQTKLDLATPELFGNFSHHKESKENHSSESDSYLSELEMHSSELEKYGWYSYDVDTKLGHFVYSTESGENVKVTCICDSDDNPYQDPYEGRVKDVIFVGKVVELIKHNKGPDWVEDKFVMRKNGLLVAELDFK
jgi:hypothetical protein